jgi:DNA-binding LacI/PurR family transcriptional regulator
MDILPNPDALSAAAGQVPTVVAGTREPVLPGVDIVANDDEHGARLATEHLIGLGHRRIAHIAGQGVVGDLRRRSFEAVMREHGLAETAIVEQGDLTEEGGYRATVRLLSARERPTAIFAFNDMAGVGALLAAEELGLRVPRDLSLVGYDNTYLARLRHLWLTTVDNASHDVGRRAAQCLLDRIADPTRPSELVLAAPVLEVRGTTAPPPLICDSHSFPGRTGVQR